MIFRFNFEQPKGVEKLFVRCVIPFPTPVLPGSGYMGVISARYFGHPCLVKSAAKLTAFF
jgi:hypothetical protein